MPYGLPNNLDKDPDAVAKMERCVAQVTERLKAKGTKDAKTRAIRICKVSLFGEEKVRGAVPTTFEYIRVGALQEHLGIDLSDLGTDAVPLEGAERGGGEDLLLFKNVELARAEVNKNRDGITEEGIDELAATLPFMPITLEHADQRVVGFFVRARNDGGRLLTDGIVFARRFPELAASLMKKGPKRLGLSIEALASFVICSVCGETFDSTKVRCEHLMDKVKYNAVRWAHGLKAIGGAITERPAASGSWFHMDDAQSVMMVASLEEVDMSDSVSGDERIDVWGEVENAHKSPPKGYPESKEQYADPKNYKYPIDEEHIRPAIAYFNRSGQREAGGYSEEEWAAVGRRIAAAATKHLGRKYVYRDGKVVPEEEINRQEGSMSEWEKEKEELLKKVSDLESAVASKDEEIAALKASVSQAQVAYERALLLAPYLPNEVIKAQLEGIGKMEQGVWDLFLASQKRIAEKEKAEQDQPQVPVAGSVPPQPAPPIAAGDEGDSKGQPAARHKLSWENIR